MFLLCQKWSKLGIFGPKIKFFDFSKCFLDISEILFDRFFWILNENLMYPKWAEWII